MSSSTSTGWTSSGAGRSHRRSPRKRARNVPCVLSQKPCRSRALRLKVETVGIEPTSAIACEVASTSVAGALISPSTRLAGGVVEGQLLSCPRRGRSRSHRVSLLVSRPDAAGERKAGLDGRLAAKQQRDRGQRCACDDPHVFVPGCFTRPPGTSTRNHPHDPTTSKPVVPGGFCTGNYTLHARAYPHKLRERPPPRRNPQGRCCLGCVYVN